MRSWNNLRINIDFISHFYIYQYIRVMYVYFDLAKIVARYSGPIKLHVVNFTDIQLYIYDKCPHDELTIIMRRYMMRIAEEFARRDGCLGLVTGESIDLLCHIYNVLLIKSNQRTIYRHRTYIIRCSQALHSLTCHLSDTLSRHKAEY